jgi:hypothetical protein
MPGCGAQKTADHLLGEDMGQAWLKKIEVFSGRVERLLS